MLYSVRGEKNETLWATPKLPDGIVTNANKYIAMAAGTAQQALLSPLACTTVGATALSCQSCVLEAVVESSRPI